MSYWIKENKKEDYVQVYEKLDAHKGWKSVLKTYDIDKFNREERHKFDPNYIYDQAAFLTKIRNGKWFVVNNKGQISIVKFQQKSSSGGKEETKIIYLWLSNDSYESMCFGEFENLSDWSIVNDTINSRPQLHRVSSFTFYSHKSFVYHIGSTDNPGIGDSIYTGEMELDEVKLKQSILDFADDCFITGKEFDQHWDNLKNNSLDNYEIIHFDH